MVSLLRRKEEKAREHKAARKIPDMNTISVAAEKIKSAGKVRAAARCARGLFERDTTAIRNSRKPAVNARIKRLLASTYS